MPCSCCGLFSVKSSDHRREDTRSMNANPRPNDRTPLLPNDAEEPNEDNGPAASAAALGVELGNSLVINLGPLIRGSEPYSIPDLRRAMSEDSSAGVTNLTVYFESYDPTSQDDQGFVRFLLQYISTSHNQHLRKLTLSGMGVFDVQDSILEGCREFLMAAAQSATIHHLHLASFRSFPIQDMVSLCRANRNIKVLESDFTTFHSDEIPGLALQGWEDAAGPAGSEITTMDKLVLDNIEFEDRLAVHTFLNELVPRLKCSDLSLGRIACLCNGADERILTPVISRLMESPVKRLELQGGCNPVVIVAALVAGATTLEELNVEFSPTWHFSILDLEVGPDVKKEFIRAVDASVTLTSVHVFDPMEINFSRDEMRLLREGRTERNREISRFVEAPDTYPARDILKLMLQLTNCPMGRFQLARNLPTEYFLGKLS